MYRVCWQPLGNDTRQRRDPKKTLLVSSARPLTFLLFTYSHRRHMVWLWQQITLFLSKFSVFVRRVLLEINNLVTGFHATGLDLQTDQNLSHAHHFVSYRWRADRNLVSHFVVVISQFSVAIYKRRDHRRYRNKIQMCKKVVMIDADTCVTSEGVTFIQLWCWITRLMFVNIFLLSLLNIPLAWQ